MGSLWEKSLQTLFHPTSGLIASGAKAYFYDEDTSTPRVVYQDAALTTPHANPVVASAAGLFPAIFLQTGNYRSRVTTSDGTQIWDVDNISPPITTEAEASGGVDDEFLYQTGDLKYRYGTGTLTGFVRANGRTIGNALSGAQERANADTSALFTFLYNADPNLSVSGGRGANAAADYAANKTIALPDLRGRVLAGLDDMGNTAAGRITSGTTLGGAGGSETQTLSTANLPSHTHDAGTLATASGGAHQHFTVNNDTSTATDVDATKSLTKTSNVVSDFSYQLKGTSTAATLGLTSSDGAHTHTMTGSTASQGSGTGHNNLQPYMLGTIYIKL